MYFGCFDDIMSKFEDTFPFAKVDDIRPVCHDMFEKDKEGITIFLTNGDMLVYYPKKEGE